MKTANSKKAFLTGISFVILQGTIYGLSDPLVKLLLNVMPVFTFLTFRYTVSATAVFLIKRKRIIRDLKRANITTYIIPSLCMAFAYLFVNLGLAATDPTRVSFVRSLSAVIVPLIAMLFCKRRLPLKALPFYILIPIGLFLICLKGNTFCLDVGCVYAFIGAVLVAAALVFGAKSIEHISPMTLTFTEIAASAVVCFTAALINGNITVAAIEPLVQIKYLFTLLYAGLVGTLLGYTLQNKALTYISAELSGVFQCSYPIATTVFSAIILSESISLECTVGISLILVSIIALSFVQMHKKKE